jgi:hypothetical protein
MAATGTAELEKVVRKVLDEEFGDDSAATLKGIQRVTRLLTDQVIPKLSNGSDEDEPQESTPEQPALRGFSMRGATPTPGKPGKPGKPEIPGEPNGELPEGAMEALEELHGSLSPEQAEALATFFKVIGEEPEEDEGDTEGAALASTGRGDRLARLEASKPDEFEAAIEALTPYVAEEDDGALSLAAPRRVISGLDKGVYATLSDYIDETNQLIRGGAGAIGVRGRSTWWKPLLRVLKLMGKALPWFKYACAVGVVVKNQGKYPGNPPEGRWLKAAARNVIKTCL